ncbi:ANTAR domain-containing protein [Aquihabitans sp. G128]|uniref:ANTAR domain-containing protein n=1 Tax=Aquihabitans sp. G128 TaxID=2849779 RepID=UPI001C22FB06|nr:ANTAR domain-containing protein [Aquihabitans sp. G128]QXC60855.1 ANTAR domain-containing protein [Aquihabitans sp. G128]
MTGASDRLVLDRLCIACVDEFELAGAGLVLVIGGTHRGAIGASDERAKRVAELAFTSGEGPSLEAHERGAPVSEPDLGRSSRWPGFTAAAVAAGICAVFSLPMRIAAEGYGALDLYRSEPGDLGEEVLDDAGRVADRATSYVLAGQSQVPPGSLTDLLADLSDDRLVVHQASGRVAIQLDVTPEAALVAMRARAFAQGCPVSEVAEAVVAGRLRFDREVRDR